MNTVSIIGFYFNDIYFEVINNCINNCINNYINNI